MGKEGGDKLASGYLPFFFLPLIFFSAISHFLGPLSSESFWKCDVKCSLIAVNCCTGNGSHDHSPGLDFGVFVLGPATIT